MRVALAVPVRDPGARLPAVIERARPRHTGLFAALIVVASPDTHAETVRALEGIGAVVSLEVEGRRGIGRARLDAFALAIRSEADHVFVSDFDRLLHWATRHGAEPAAMVASIGDADLVVLGRTERALATHPAPQRETERLVNLAFGVLTGRRWDVMTGCRALSRAAASSILAHAPDDATITTDTVWPLLILRAGGFSIRSIEVEGLEYETPDRYADEVEAAGGRDAWIGVLEADPEAWARRVHAANLAIEGMRQLSGSDGRSPVWG